MMRPPWVCSQLRALRAKRRKRAKFWGLWKERMRVAQEGYRTASLSLELVDKTTHLTNLNKFLRWFCLNLSRELGLPSQLDES
uniref:Uncharacterized protein n=1 Tax=Nostoc flagelliforme str. Sunitezuoqi TaxID=676037 RepID=E7DQE1_9NOSO|nr:hypothetical protein Nfla_9101 [Nostoc flagelliforme str. Sunitezuoqi]